MSFQKASEMPSGDSDMMTTPSTSSTMPSALNRPSVNLASTSKNANLTKRQQAAHRTRVQALSKQLATRLQYAAFKVEHGWSRQSHSEVENLYYRHRRGISTSGPSSPHARKSNNSTISTNTPQTPSLSSGNFAKLPKINSSSIETPSLSSSTNAATLKRPSDTSTADVFGGLVTPPASGGTQPSHMDVGTIRQHLLSPTSSNQQYQGNQKG